MERVVKDELLRHLLSNDLISPNQSAFIPKRSTNTQLLKYFNYLSNTLSSADQLDAVYVDFSKAFDKIVHNKLLSKLHLYGIEGKILEWIKCFQQCSMRQSRPSSFTVEKRH
jgi:hypothetical protein